jgi:putative oxidoreductase
MPKPVTVARVLLGLMLIAFGADWFYHFLPFAGEVTPQGEAFLNALVETGYLFTLIKSIEVIAGVLLLTGFRPQLGAALVAPVAVNIALYHLLLDPNGALFAAPVVGLEAYLLWAYRDAFAPLFAARPAEAPARRAPAAAAVPAIR